MLFWRRSKGVSQQRLHDRGSVRQLMVFDDTQVESLLICSSVYSFNLQLMFFDDTIIQITLDMLVWKFHQAGAGAENITQGVLITTHSVRPISRDELRVRPSTGEQGARKRVFIKVRPSTGEWKSSRGSVGKSDRSHGAFEDRTFALDGKSCQ